MDKTDELIEILEKTIETERIILSEEEIEKASNSKDDYLRERISEVLSYYPIEFACKILLKLLYDPNKNVRSSVAMYLGAGYYGVNAQEALFERLCNDKDNITRGLAASTLAEVYSKHSEEDAEKIFQMLEIVSVKDKDYFVKASCYGGLYLIKAKEEYLNKLFDCYKSKNYRTRCATVNILIQIATKDNAGIIVEFSKKVLNKENSKAVISTIYTLINRCDLLMKE